MGGSPAPRLGRARWQRMSRGCPGTEDQQRADRRHGVRIQDPAPPVPLHYYYKYLHNKPRRKDTDLVDTGRPNPPFPFPCTPCTSNGSLSIDVAFYKSPSILSAALKLTTFFPFLHFEYQNKRKPKTKKHAGLSRLSRRHRPHEPWQHVPVLRPQQEYNHLQCLQQHARARRAAFDVLRKLQGRVVLQQGLPESSLEGPQEGLPAIGQGTAGRPRSHRCGCEYLGRNPVGSQRHDEKCHVFDPPRRQLLGGFS